LLFRRRHVEAYGESPQALFDLAAVFYRLAELNLEMAHLESAKAQIGECLDLLHRHQHLFARTPQLCGTLASALGLAAEISEKNGQESDSEAYLAERETILAEQNTLLGNLASSS
jgi:hypothetical protein